MYKRAAINSSITCPHCWIASHPADLLWISPNSDDRGDPFLGDVLKRFLPSRFDVHCKAIDEYGLACDSIACPGCHLGIPRILVETRPMFISILGAPSSGKSYFLASSIWQTRQKLFDFKINFVDADPVANKIISDYEKKLFLTDNPEQLVAVPKTERVGELYQEVDYGTRFEYYPRPFVFSVRPESDHPIVKRPSDISQHARALCLYDNAGEHFLPELASEISPATNHLALSKALLFVFDPLQHPKFRQMSREHSEDPQLGKRFKTHRQDEILQEAAKRIRKKANLSQNEKFKKPLIVVINKYDVWHHLVPKIQLEKLNPYLKDSRGVVGVNWSLIQKLSQSMEKFLSSMAPEIITACRSFSHDITYIPASPLGGSPEPNPEKDDDRLNLGVRPKNLAPIWAEVPLIYAMSLGKNALIPRIENQSIKAERVR